MRLYNPENVLKATYCLFASFLACIYTLLSGNPHKNSMSKTGMLGMLSCFRTVPIAFSDSDICARTSLLLVLTLVLVFAENHVSSCFHHHTNHCLPPETTFPHGNHRTPWIGLPTGKPFFLSQCPWIPIAVENLNIFPQDSEASLSNTGHVGSVLFGSAHSNAHYDTFVLRPAYLILFIASGRCFGPAFMISIWGCVARTSETRMAMMLCLLCPALFLHCRYCSTVTSEYHYQFLVHNWENPKFRHMEAGVKLVCQS